MSLKSSGLFDTHAHYNDEKFNSLEGGKDALLEHLFAGSVEYILNASVDIEDSINTLSLCEKYPNIYAALGVYPHETGKISESESEFLQRLAKLLSHPKAKALGEIGLDYHYDDTDRETQKKWFRSQLSLARDLDIPVVIHDREAHGDLISILKEFKGIRGIMHSYSASAEMVREFEDLGFYISFSGSLTFKNARKTVEAAAVVSKDRLLIETDCPYLTPVPHRGEINNSLLMMHTAEFLANIRGMELNELIDLTNKNARELLGI